MIPMYNSAVQICFAVVSFMKEYGFLMMFKKFLNFRYLILFLTMISFALHSPHTFAAAGKGDIFTRFKKDMPAVNKLSELEFEKVTKIVKKKPYGDRALAYSINIPKKWTEKDSGSSSNFVISTKLFLELNTFYGKPTPYGRSRLEINVLKLDGNLTAEQWYLKYVLEGGFTTVGFVVHNEEKVESLMVLLEKDRSFYVRTVVVFNADNVIMLRFFVPVANIQAEAAMQAQVVESFKLLYDIERPLANMNTYSFLDIIDLKYPKQWKLYTKAVRDVDRMSITLMNTREYKNRLGIVKSTSTQAKMDVTVVSSSSEDTLVDEVAKYKRKMELDGMLIGKKIETDDKFKYHENIDFALTEIYEGVDSTNNFSEYEFWFTVMVGGNYYFFLMLLTPSRNDRFGIWAENTQNYKRIVEEVAPMAGAFLERDY
ncbi:MAG: hypothetical protein COA45_02955 [Zetaproteobacteria bacterium]|nr:MAG: hypothetical protein COA45_02955 [Zetaproteobacteria bacterium]